MQFILKQWYFIRAELTPQGTFGNVLKYFCHSWLGAPGIWLVEAKDVAKHNVIHRTAPTKWNYPAPDVRSAQVNKPVLKDYSIYS